MSKQTITTIIIALVFFGLGFYSGRLYPIGLKGENTFEAGWQAAKQRLSETGFMPMFGKDMEITSLSGEVKEVKGNKISLKISPLEPLADPNLDNRIVEVDEKTKIYRLIEKDPAQYQAEMEEFERKMGEEMENPEEIPEPVVFPEMYNKEEAGLADIEVDQRISVKTEEDIKEVKQFKAVEITIQSVPARPTGPVE